MFELLNVNCCVPPTGSIYFLSLMDEQLLVSAETPRQLLAYAGRVHVRDLALMLEELLYFYRPLGEEVAREHVLIILKTYDVWVTKHCEPLESDVMQSVASLLESACVSSATASGPEKDRLLQGEAQGYFTQNKMVATMHLGELVKDVFAYSKGVEKNKKDTNNSNRDSAVKSTKNGTAKWSDIRSSIDKTLNMTNHSESDKSNVKDHKLVASVASRAAQKKGKQAELHIAHATVSFKIFVKWIQSMFSIHAKILRDKHLTNG